MGDLERAGALPGSERKPRELPFVPGDPRYHRLGPLDPDLNHDQQAGAENK